MADVTKRLPTNVPGPWYVDSNCIDCDLCRETAPTVFKRDDENGNSFVFHQPETEEELRLAREAMEGCPVEAIGNDHPASPPPATEAAKAPGSTP
ncbi:MAG TPA: ferredoxin [Verrucomicrobiae bacterium]|jgi:ferredoxin|nr:ferredoxin [Verrucomicrobiae bacterium]